jgi:hypothetical protein
MMPRRRDNLAAQRFAERRRREDEAPRLCREVPALRSLEITIEERTSVGGMKYIRRFPVDQAPALFLVPCGDPRCTAGEHDLTTAVIHALRARETTFHGTDECVGSVGTEPCPRVVKFDCAAQYRP